MTINRSTFTALSITAGSLASAANRSSAAVTVTDATSVTQIEAVVSILTTTTAPTGNKQVQVYAYASVDGTNYFDIARSAAGIITGASGLIVIPIHGISDGLEAAANTYTGFLSTTALGAATTRPGIPWRSLKVDLVNTGAGTTTYTATIYALNQQAIMQGMG